MLSITNPKKVMKREVLTTRKNHECYHCSLTISKGSEAVNIDTRFDGKLYPVYLHPACEQPAKALEVKNFGD